MAEEEVVQSPGSDAGAGGDTTQQAAAPTSQEAGQEQSSEGASVGSTSTGASSKGGSGGNVSWANQRLIEKTVAKSLQSALKEHLSPIVEQLRSTTQPQTTPVQSQEKPDWENLDQWINRRIETGVETRLQKELQSRLGHVERSISEKVRNDSKLQEAKNYLYSQKDIGRNPETLAEVQRVIENSLLIYALDSEPLEVTKQAVERWRSGRQNPNAPPKSHLSTVPGGTVSRPQAEPSVEELRKLQVALANNPTIEEREKLEARFNSLVGLKP